MSNEPDLSPQEGADALFSLINDVTKATEDGDLGRLEDLIDQMQMIANQTGVDVPGMAGQIERLKRQSRQAKTHFANTDAALWAGDLQRAEHLALSGPPFDLATLNMVDEARSQDAGYDEDPELDAMGLTFDLADFAADLGVEFEPGGLIDPPDLFADLAAGLPGALDMLIDTDADLNTPSGPARHTALLAALDAPGRTAQTLERLIAAGADPKVIHAEGDNTISWAMGYHHPETVNEKSEADLIACLVAHGANVNHSVAGQITALQRGILQAGAPQVAALLAVGADQTVDMASDFHPEILASVTTVMLAAAKPDVLRLLLDYGADAARPDATGRIPLDFVKQQAEAARDRVDLDDDWTVDHAEALEISLGILERHLNQAG
ncbi:MAG: hypothetical protein AAGM21_11150 [Pseudomonadota bacterium]